MYGNDGFVTGTDFNRFVNLDNIEWHIIDYLLKDQSKYSAYLWRILKYNTEDCLNLPDLTLEEKKALVYVGNGDSTPYRVFMTPYLDDAWVEQSAHLHIYVSSVFPKNNISSVVNINFECICHNKIVNILGDASEYNKDTNPVEIHNGDFTTPYKSRTSVFLKCIVAALNGAFVNGVGVLQFNERLSSYNNSKLNLWNGKKFIGHIVAMSTLLSGTSGESECGY